MNKIIILNNKPVVHFDFLVEEITYVIVTALKKTQETLEFMSKESGALTETAGGGAGHGSCLPHPCSKGRTSV